MSLAHVQSFVIRNHDMFFVSVLYAYVYQERLKVFCVWSPVLSLHSLLCCHLREACRPQSESL